ncbi:branched-chain amino acid transport system ATP-binding protein [Ferrithrix thermotolerans DSM 19514]|uniref:Branched-chain amino acid transport system ATP-binding protein n=1 Tax=Ferrithrix thermotolerans DSM 19514 TaxID=1121881 RepID=A0A1M4S7B4_9ACTN|nr:ATP-binding cassette domain-containing protein [Ferrithrix thermotolerans]SHE28071.1 branched-chain amino acid transport system ATP-binding protein [Ferrithrix thermotolerans DSM 19514]
MSKLVVEELSVSLEGKRVLEGISFEVDTVDIVGIVGANGAGKTTLLNAVAGLIQTTTGKISLDGVDVSQLGPEERIRRSLGYVPDGPGVFRSLTVRENLMVGGMVRGDEDIEMVITLFPDLKNCLSMLAGSLSAYQRRQCAFGRALMSRPSLLMIDELSLGLSPISADALARTLPDIAAYQVGIILVEQDIDRTLSLVDRAYVIEGGSIVVDGSPGELLSQGSFVEKYLWGS